MRRFCIVIIGLAVLCAPIRAVAAGMDIGMTTWYCRWQPSWNNKNSGYRVEPAVFYGPGVSFRLPGNVTISTNFLYARILAETPVKILNLVNPSVSTRVIQRYDSDSTIGYSFTAFFRLFLGFKYSRYNYVAEQMQLAPGILWIFSGTREKYRYDNYAPALGLNFKVHVVEHFFILITASFLYEQSHVFKSKYQYLISSGASPMFFPYKDTRWAVNKLGANASLAFAYFIKPINTSISIGFRYQFFKTVKPKTDNDEYSEYYDHFYGLTASAIYKIDFGKNIDRDEKEER